MLVAVSCDRRLGRAGEGPRVRPGRPEVWVSEHTVEQLRAVGLTPLLLPPGPTDLDRVLDVVGGVVITGGAFDIHPAHYGQAVTARLDAVDEARTDLELRLVRECARRKMPLLGICGGMQAMIVGRGGGLLQDIADDGAKRGVEVLQHEQQGDPATPGHPLRCEPGWEWLGDAVNSTHHQAADPARLGGLHAIAYAPDGTIEAVTAPDAPMIGVQWHPELLPGSNALFQYFADHVHRHARALASPASLGSRP
jgi:putative glutamine amidotransferase